MALSLVTSLALAGAAMGSGVTNAGDDLRTGWYPDEAAITPQLVSGGTFGQLWSAPVNGQVYAQPLLSPTGTLIVATENDKVYGLDPETGATLEILAHPGAARVVRVYPGGFAERARRKLGITDPAGLADFDMAGHER